MTALLRTVLVGPDADKRGHLRALVEGTPSLSAVGHFASVNAAVAASTTTKPDLVIVELPDANGAGPAPLVAGVERLARAFPESAVLATGDGSSAEFVVQVLRAGAFEFVARPMRPDDLAAALAKLTRFRRPTPTTTERTARVTSVFSTKGGLGTTTVAINLAVCFAEQHHDTSLLVELDSRQSDVATFLDLRARYSIFDALENVERMDEAFLKGVLTRHASGLWVLPGPARIERTRLAADHVQAGLDIMRREFDEIVLDLPHDMEPATIAALDLSDTVLFLTTLNVSAVRSSAAGLAALRHLGIDQRKVKVVVMREGSGEEVTPKHVQDALGCPVFWKTPNDYRTVVAAINAGKPVVTASPRSKFAKSLRQLADALTGQGAATPVPAKRASSLLNFGWGTREAEGI